jgi:putative protein kinase ArgK-like GTPase of G3E family
MEKLNTILKKFKEEEISLEEVKQEIIELAPAIVLNKMDKTANNSSEDYLYKLPIY